MSSSESRTPFPFVSFLLAWRFCKASNSLPSRAKPRRARSAPASSLAFSRAKPSFSPDFLLSAWSANNSPLAAGAGAANRTAADSALGPATPPAAGLSPAARASNITSFSPSRRSRFSFKPSESVVCNALPFAAVSNNSKNRSMFGGCNLNSSSMCREVFGPSPLMCWARNTRSATLSCPCDHGCRNGSTLSSNSQRSRNVLSFLLARYGLTTAMKNFGSFFARNTLSSWHANLEYFSFCSSGFNFGQLRMNENSANFGSCVSVVNSR